MHKSKQTLILTAAFVAALALAPALHANDCTSHQARHGKME